MSNKLTIGIITFVVVAGGWYMLSGNSSSAPTLTTASAIGASPSEQNLVTTLLALHAVKLDGTILQDPAFMSLKDFSTQIIPEPVGRMDPFASFATSTSNAAASTASTSQLFTPHSPASDSR